MRDSLFRCVSHVGAHFFIALKKGDRTMSGEKKTPKTTSNIATGIAMAASIVPLVKPAIEAVRDYADKTIEERKKLVVVSKLYSSEYRTTSEQAVEILTSLGLKAVLSPTLIDDADGKYRNCINNQVIKSEPKARQKVEPGTTVRVLYITQEVIDESRCLFNESEKRKAELLLEKSIKRSERKEKTKRVVSDVADTVKRGVGKIPSVLHKKNNDKEEHNE